MSTPSTPNAAADVAPQATAESSGQPNSTSASANANAAVEPTPQVHTQNNDAGPSTSGTQESGNVASPELETAGDIPQTPQVALTFLLVSGKRRTMVFEPETTIGRVKELAWNSWPADWREERPAAPSYLRILYLGKMLQDDETLTTLKLPTHIPAPDRAPPTNPPPTILHLSVRAYPPNNASDATKKKRKRRSTGVSTTEGQDEPGGEERRGLGCCIIC